jgi:hypothetical protein
MLYLFQLNRFWILLSGQKPWMLFSYKIILVIQHYHFSTSVVHWASCEVIQVRIIIYFVEWPIQWILADSWLILLFLNRERVKINSIVPRIYLQNLGWCLTPSSRVLLEELVVPQLVKNSLHFMEYGSSLQCLQKVYIILYSEPNESSPDSPNLFA